MRKSSLISRFSAAWRRGRQHERRSNPVSALRLETLAVRVPSRFEQIVQILTRYLFCILGLMFFNVAFPEPPNVVPRELINWTYSFYLVFNTLSLVHLLRKPNSWVRYRIHMWVDICMVSLALVGDPNEVPPAALVYIMVVLGNGMRYGLRMFGEAVIGSFAGAMIAVSLRHAGSDGLPPGLLFLNLFGGIILIYAYTLMIRVEAQRRALQNKSFRDALTGLLNRAGLELIAARLFADSARSGTPFAVLFADMDNFKQVNDRFGHAEGDRVLRELAKIMSSEIRASDVAGRYGGDEFVLLLPGTSAQEAEIVARRTQARIDEWSRRNQLGCSISVGVGEAPTDGTDLLTVLHRVDQAMYATKRRRSGHYQTAITPDPRPVPDAADGNLLQP